MSFQFQILPADTYSILSLEGRIMTDENIPALLEEVTHSIEKGKASCVINCEKLSYCNSTGLNMFIKILTKTRNSGGDCVLVGLQPTVQKLFELSKLNEIFTSYTSLDEALTRFL